MPEHPSCLVLPFSLGLEKEHRLGGRRMGLIPAQFSLLVTIAKPRSSLPEMKDLDSCSADLSRICDVSEEGGKQPFPDPCCMDTTRHVLAPNVWPPPFLPFAFFLTVHCLSFSLSPAFILCPSIFLSVSAPSFSPPCPYAGGGHTGLSHQPLSRIQFPHRGRPSPNPPVLIQGVG